MKTIIIASGYFNPLHKGHIEYLEKASQLGLYLYVIVNNDKQVELKGSVPFMDLNERVTIIRALRFVNYVIPASDEDLSVCNTIEGIFKSAKFIYGDDIEVIFAKGGDRNKGNIPENEVCKRLGIKIVDGLGKKIQSSSELLKNYEPERVSIKIKMKNK